MTKEMLIQKSKNELHEKEKTMKLSVREGAASSVMSGLGVSYVSLYALEGLKANNTQIGLLSSFPSLLSPISQIFGSKLMEKYPRKKLIVFGVTIQSLMWIPILLLSVLFWRDIWKAYLPYFLILFYSLYAIFGSIAGPAWFSLMGDIVPEKIRGKYFSRRSRIAEIVVLATFLIGGFILDISETKGLALIGFSLIFFLSFLFRYFSSRLFQKHYEPKLEIKDGYYFSLFEFLKKAPFNNFGTFVIFVALMQFATAIAGPFFMVYMKKELGFSYLTYMIVTLCSSLASILFLPIWGKFSDKYGSRELLKLGGILVPLLPICWLFSKSPIYIAIVPQIIGGIGWAAFNLAASNFIYDTVTPQRRGICVAYFNFVSGVGIFVGAILGGFLAEYLTISFMNKYLFIFLISGVLRGLSSLIFIPKIKESKIKVKAKPPWMYLKEIRPNHGTVHELQEDVYKSIKYLTKV